VQGHAVGGGFALAMACDFRVAAEDALFHVPEVDLGIPLSWGATPRIIHEVGPLRAREIILLCERLDAARALDWGIVNRVAPEAGLDAELDTLVARLVAKPELAVHMTLTQFRGYAAGATLGDATEADGDLLFAASGSAIARKSFGSE
jgi:enoyl-CoA hydratase/carnithine racemase